MRGTDCLPIVVLNTQDENIYNPRSVSTNRTLRCVKLFYCAGISMFIISIIYNNNNRQEEAEVVHLRQATFSEHSVNIQ